MLKKVVFGTICVTFTIIFGLLTVKFLGPVLAELPPYLYYGLIAVIAIVIACVGVLLAQPLTRRLERGLQKAVDSFSAMSTADVTGHIIGLIFGLIIAALLGTIVARIDIIGSYLSIIFALLLGYLGWLVGGKMIHDLPSLHQEREGKTHKVKPERRKGGIAEQRDWDIPPKVIDTSVIIDGRIADIYRTGFLEGDLVIPNFVLEELRHIADSADALKRNRGRGGLDTLNRMREQFASRIIITEQDYPKVAEVDSKLLCLARDINGMVVTNDFNLNKVARLQGVQVLNINELANAVKPILLPGEEMTVQVIREGKEAGQGVAYLDDGTMIVVENGVRYVGSSIPVVVTSILQTAAGRMVFARLRQ